MTIGFTSWVLLAALLGAVLNRWRGSPQKYLPRPLPQIALAVPYGIACLTAGWLTATIVFALTLAAWCTGHGGFIDLGSWTLKRQPERLEFIIAPLYGRIPDYWYDALGLAITGLAVTLPAGMVTLNPLLAISGVLKAPAYMLAKALGWGTAGGEIITGAALWGALAAFTF